jgi:uncharacterized protein
MDTLWLIVSILLMIGGVLGCLLPLLPGPPLSFLALLVLQLRSDPPFTAQFLWIWAGITIVVTVLDYVVPIYGTKKFGGTKAGVWGCTIGLVLGFLIPPWGIILGPFLGALAGEIIFNKNSEHALKAALGSFVGFVLGTLLKLVACVMMIYYMIKYL